MKKVVYIPDIECDSCSKLISKKLQKEGINGIKIHADSVEVDFDDSRLSADDVKKDIKSLGFRASFEPFERKSLKERWRDFKENRHKYELESKVVSFSIGIFVLLSLLEGLAYLFFFKNMPNFLQNYGWWLFYLNISVVSVAVGMWHVASYKAKITCMAGMMIGMTVGMQAGMMLGAVIGATNGFFVGCMAGMIIGVLVGIYAGKCCGVMGVMEGMMAGLMGGTMGPMISVMMFSDHLLVFMPFYMLVNVVIMWGLSYMMYEEVVENKDNVEKKPLDFVSLASIAVISTILLVILMVYGMKSPLVSF